MLAGLRLGDGIGGEGGKGGGFFERFVCWIGLGWDGMGWEMYVPAARDLASWATAALEALD